MEHRDHVRLLAGGVRPATSPESPDQAPSSLPGGSSAVTGDEASGEASVTRHSTPHLTSPPCDCVARGEEHELSQDPLPEEEEAGDPSLTRRYAPPSPEGGGEEVILPTAGSAGKASTPLSPRERVGAERPGEGTHPGAVWADLGSGTGAFTLALAELLGPAGQIYSVDRDASALRVQERAMRLRFPETVVHYVEGDFRRPLDLPSLDGVVMANSLHFVRDKEPILQHIRENLKRDGRFILVEYNTDHGNPWVPYPISYPAWERMALRSGFREITLLAVQPSRFLSQIYSALSRM